MWQLGEAIRGIGDACRALGIPVTGGNVSLYNETDGEAIYPTPVLGIVGLLEDASQTVTRLFRTAGASVVLLGEHRGELGGSEYLALLHDRVAGSPPELDLSREQALQRLVVRAIREGLVESAHDCAEGGLAIALAECCFDSSIGVTAEVKGVGDVPQAFRVNATVFGESASRVVVSAPPGKTATLLSLAAELAVPAQVIGRTGGHRITITVDGTAALDVAAADAERIWTTSIERKMRRD
jgi:phosphoribosylformylglycinamidine synthase